MLALVLGGIGGTIYKVISPDGWVAHGLRPQPVGGRRGARLARAGRPALAWFSRSWGDGRTTASLFSHFLVYGFAAAGILYLVQLWTKGTL